MLIRVMIKIKFFVRVYFMKNGLIDRGKWVSVCEMETKLNAVSNNNVCNDCNCSE